MRRLILAVALSLAPVAAQAQGLASWVGDRVGLGDVGRTLDDANRRAKDAVPIYGQAEEAASGTVRHVTREAVVETAGPALKNAILMSRDNALAAGAGPLPPEVVWEFNGFYSPDVLNARWRVGQGHELSVQANAFRFGDAAAIALDTVVVFRDIRDAYSPWLWAHELAHIEQYRAWGVDDFAKRYVRDHGSIEAAANRRADEFMAWRQRRLMAPTAAPMQSRVPGMPPPPALGMICMTPVMMCQIPPYPRGGGCTCFTPYGPAYGVVQ